MKKENLTELDDTERQECEVWTRVMGYHRPVASFNTGKKQEFADRKNYTLDKPVEVCYNDIDSYIDDILDGC